MNNQDLHSFPTRRSSDLARAVRRFARIAPAPHDRQSRAGHRENPVSAGAARPPALSEDRKSTRLNSSHANISYAVFCLKKKTVNDVMTHSVLILNRHGGV